MLPAGLITCALRPMAFRRPRTRRMKRRPSTVVGQRRQADWRAGDDVIAGTSAGGLNGVLLATAIARGASLGDLKQLWLESGQMSAEALFRPQPEGELSLMNGDFFHDQITGALQKMTPTAYGRDISLIVTSTALGPSSRSVRDSNGEYFSEADHRRRFHFSRHESRPRYVQIGNGYELQDCPPVDDLADDEPLTRSTGRRSGTSPRWPTARSGTSPRWPTARQAATTARSECRTNGTG